MERFTLHIHTQTDPRVALNKPSLKNHHRVDSVDYAKGIVSFSRSREIEEDLAYVDSGRCAANESSLTLAEARTWKVRKSLR